MDPGRFWKCQAIVIQLEANRANEGQPLPEGCTVWSVHAEFNTNEGANDERKQENHG